MVRVLCMFGPFLHSLFCPMQYCVGGCLLSDTPFIPGTSIFLDLGRRPSTFTGKLLCLSSTLQDPQQFGGL